VILGGVFVGGASRRMGRPKGLLVGPDGRTLIARAQRALRDAGAEPVLVGRRPEYAALGPAIDDALPDAGPLAGLVALLEQPGADRVIALACDMPFVTADDLRALLAVDARVVAPRRDGRWEPLCAVYSSHVAPIARERLEAGRRSLQGLLDAVGATEAALDPDHLNDWDAPEDVSAS